MKTARHSAVRTPAQRRARPARGRGGRGFSLIELLTVISIIGILAAIGAGLAGVASRKSKEAATKAELGKLVTAIESYRADFNQYPPDSLVRKSNGDLIPAVNPLYYELSGTISTHQGRAYHLTDHDELVSVAQIQQLFGRKGFLNSVDAPDKPKPYLQDVKERQLGELAVGDLRHVDILLAPVDWPLKVVGNVNLRSVAPLSGIAGSEQQLRMNPWQYVSTNPTNNLNSFDLWADVWIGNKRQIIGNFKTE